MFLASVPPSSGNANTIAWGSEWWCIKEDIQTMFKTKAKRFWYVQLGKKWHST